MPRIFGSPTAKAAAILRSRDDFTQALRTNDQKALSGLDDDDDSVGLGMLDFAALFPGVQTNRFSGFSDYLAAGTKKVWIAARAVDIIANVVLSTDMKIIWRDPEKNKAEAKIKPDKELTRLLQNPNPYDTISEMMYLWVAHMKLTGNAFWFKDEMDGYGRPKNVFWLNPRFITIVPDKNLRVGKYIYRINSAQIEFTPDEIIHWKRPHANHALWGLGEIESGESLYDDFINRSLFNSRFMANGAVPSAIMVNEEYDGTPEDWSKVQSNFREKYSGVSNTGKVAWLNGKWKLLQMGIDAQKMQEIEKAKGNKEDIFINHGVPLSVAGYGSANYATARVEDIAFRKYTVLPLLNLFTDAFNSPRGFIQAFTSEHRLDFSLTGIVDVEQVMKEAAPQFDRAALTPNDIREMCGLPRVKNPLLDQYYIPANYVPLEIAGVTSPTDAELDAAAKPKPRSGETNTADGETKPKPKKNLEIAA